MSRNSGVQVGAGVGVGVGVQSKAGRLKPEGSRGGELDGSFDILQINRFLLSHWWERDRVMVLVIYVCEPHFFL